MDTPNPLQVVYGLVAAFTSGSHTLTLLAEDRAGNASQAEVTFTVYPVEWLPPLGNSKPYPAEIGRTIPVKFKVYDLEGAVMIDNSVELRLLDAAGNIVCGPFSLSSNPNQGVAVLAIGSIITI